MRFRRDFDATPKLGASSSATSNVTVEVAARLLAVLAALLNQFVKD